MEIGLIEPRAQGRLCAMAGGVVLVQQFRECLSGGADEGLALRLPLAPSGAAKSSSLILHVHVFPNQPPEHPAGWENNKLSLYLQSSGD
jgi:hypothetical protein